MPFTENKVKNYQNHIHGFFFNLHDINSSQLHWREKQQADVFSQARECMCVKVVSLEVYFFNKAYDQQSNDNLVSVIKVSSFSVKHDFSLSFKKPNPCTRNITLFCVPEFAKKEKNKNEKEVVISQRMMLAIKAGDSSYRTSWRLSKGSVKLISEEGKTATYSPSKQKDAFWDFKKFLIRTYSK